ncbi:MAG: IMPACT family protein [Desulfitobacteriaceae bacterium]
MEGYNSIPEKTSREQVIEKSRFIGIVFPVQTNIEIDTAIKEVRTSYPGAKHYVYAYRLAEGRQEKSSDDGEPQGTGGRPILEILQYRKVWNALLVVVRYFGGILLGTGGLTRAYSGTARQLIDTIQLQMLIPHSVYSLQVTYAWYERLKYQFQFHPWLIERESFGEFIEIEIAIPEYEASGFSKWLLDFTAGQVSYVHKHMILQAARTQ